VKEYKLQVPDDTVGISITVFRQQKKKRLFARNFVLKNILETYTLDLSDKEEPQHE
jgi:hypothetical protein